MHRCVPLALLCTALMLTATGCGSREAASEDDVLTLLARDRTEAEAATMVERGHRLFWSKSCQNCHVLEGAERNAPRLAYLYHSKATLTDGQQIKRTAGTSPNPSCTPAPRSWRVTRSRCPTTASL